MKVPSTLQNLTKIKVMRLNKKGQGLIEAICALFLVLIIISGTAVLLHRILLFYLADYHLHEATLCGVSQNVRICTQEINKRLRPFILNDMQMTISITKNRRMIASKLEIYMNPPLKIEKQYQWAR